MKAAQDDLERAVLTVQLEEATFFRRPDGTCTADTSAALRSHAAELAARSGEGAAIAGALVRQPVTPTPGPPTPSRIDAIRQVITAGLLPSGAAAELIASGRVDDAAWALLRPLVGLLRIPRFEGSVWRIRFERLPALQPLPLPVVGSPLDERPDEAYPVAYVDRIRMAVAQRGWRLYEVTFSYDDDRELDDDWIPADALVDSSALLRARYLLVRHPGVDHR